MHIYTVFATVLNHEGKKVKLPLCLTSQSLNHEDIWGNGSVTPPILTTALDGCKWSASHYCRFISRKKIPFRTHRIEGWLVPQNRSGCCGEEKKRAMPGTESGRLARNPSLYHLSYPNSIFNHKQN
jgi:hypothetical protein